MTPVPPVVDGRVRRDSGGPFDALVITTPDGRQVKLNSQRDPASEADRFVAAACASSEPSAVIVVGLGLGYVLDAIERASAKTRVIGLEPLPECLPFLAERGVLERWRAGGRLAVFTGPAYDGATEAFRMFDGRGTPPPVLVNPVLEREYPHEAARARAAAESLVAGAIANEAARRRFSGPYLLNTLRNVAAIAAEGDVASLADAFAGRPGIVVGAGPSLDRQLPVLAQIQEHVLLVAVDTALRPLLSAGIRPHFVVAVDPQPNNAKHLLGLPPTDDTWLVAEGSVDPAVFPGFGGRTFVFKVSDHQPWPWLAASGLTRSTLKAWGSVLTTAFDLACRLGCDPVVFAGADLAYTGGLLYCRNTTYEPDWKPLETDDARASAFEEYVTARSTAVATNTAGETVPTTPLFLQFRDWLVSRSLAMPERRVVNATGAGILRGGRIEIADLQSMRWPEEREPVPTLRDRIARAWSAGDRDPQALLQKLGATLAPALRWPPNGGAEPLRTFLDFTSETSPPPALLKALFDLLRAEDRAPFMAGLRRQLNAAPAPGPDRALWASIGHEEQRASHPAARRAWDGVDPWAAPDAWAAIEPDPDNPEPGVGGTALSMITPDASQDFHTPWYLHLNARRLEHLASLGLDLRRKTVLEVGAGIGDLTSFFTDRECAVLATDARDTNVRRIQERFGQHPFVKTAALCLDPPPDESVGSFDVVFCYGLLYHLSDPDAALAYLATCCRGTLLIDSTIHLDSCPLVTSEMKDPSVATASVSGVLAKPGRAWLHARLSELFDYVYVPEIQPNHYLYPVDWNRPVQPGARVVFVASRQPIDSPLLHDGLPSLQRRH